MQEALEQRLVESSTMVVKSVESGIDQMLANL